MGAYNASRQRHANSIWYVLRIKQHFGELSKQLGLSMPQVVVLVTVLRGTLRHAPLDVTEVAEEAGIPRANTIRHLKELASRGLIYQVLEGKRTLNCTPEIGHHRLRVWLGDLDRLMETINRHRRQASKSVQNGQ